MAIVKVLTGAENTTLDKETIEDTAGNISETVVQGDNVREEALITSSFADNSVFAGHVTTHPYPGPNYLSSDDLGEANHNTTVADLSPLGFALLDFGGTDIATTESFRWYGTRTLEDMLTGAIIVRASCQIHWGPYVDGYNYGMEYQRSTTSQTGPTVVECMIRYAIQSNDTWDDDPSTWAWNDINYTRQRFGMSWSSLPTPYLKYDGTEAGTENPYVVNAPGKYSANFNYTGVAAITTSTDTTDPDPDTFSGQYVRFGLFGKLTEGSTSTADARDSGQPFEDGISTDYEIKLRFRCGTITATQIMR